MILFCFIGRTVAAGDGGAGVQAPTPDEWAREVRTSLGSSAARPSSAAYAGRLLVLKSCNADEMPSQVALTRPSFRTESFLDLVMPDAMALAVKANRESSDQGERTSLLVSVRAELLLCKQGDDTWKLGWLDEALHFEYVAEGLRLMAASPAGFGATLRSALGYDAIVVDRRGPYVLAKTMDLSHEADKDLQALVLAGTERFIRMDDANKHGAGLLRLVAGGAEFSVFKILTLNAGVTLGMGTKLSLGAAKP